MRLRPFKSLLFLLLWVPAYLLQAAPRSPALEAFEDRLSPEGWDALGCAPGSLSDAGFELRDRLLKPRLDALPPVDPELIAAKATTIFEERGEAVERIMAGQVKLLGGIPWQTVGDPIDWFTAPEGDLQWTTHLHRHYFLFAVAFAYRRTQDPVYAEKIIGVIDDWIDRFPLEAEGLKWLPAEDSWSRRWSDPAMPPSTREGVFPSYVDGPWTALSADARVGFWLELLQLLEDSPALNNATLAKIFGSLMGDHRQVMLDYPRQMNQFQAVAIGLIRLGLYFPYLEGAENALETGWQRLAQHTEREIYPDGSMAECSPNYGMGMLRNLADVLEKATLAGQYPPSRLRDRLELGLRYMALISDPRLHLPRIAKGGQDTTTDFKRLRETLAVPAVDFRLGLPVEAPPRSFPTQILFPWAGHVVMRSDWSETATWLFFEPGPRGSGHADAAQLGIQLQANGAWLLVDPGYYSYSGVGEAGKMSRYLRSTAAHNSALVDGHGQLMTAPGEAKSYNLEAGEYRWKHTSDTFGATGVYSYGYGENGALPIQHKRTLAATDRLDRITISDTMRLAPGANETAASKHRFEWRWQLHPDASVTLEGTEVVVTNGTARMRLSTTLPPEFADEAIRYEILQGSRSPMAGWYSEKYGELSPAPMLRLQLEAAPPFTLTTTLAIEALESAE